MRNSGYVASVAWAAGTKGDNAIKAANKSADLLFDAIPYIKRFRTKNAAEQTAASNDMSIGEALMRKFMAEDKARKAAENRAAAEASTEGEEP